MNANEWLRNMRGEWPYPGGQMLVDDDTYDNLHAHAIAANDSLGQDLSIFDGELVFRRCILKPRAA